jgi:hypothetical protein
MSKKKRLSRSKAEAQAIEETIRYMEMFLNPDHPAQSPGTACNRAALLLWRTRTERSTFLNIQQFATAHDLKTRNEDGVKIIPGIDESHIYQYDDTHFGVVYMDSLEKNHATYRKQCLALGMEIHQDGDTEFAATFDPKNEKQAKQAIRVAGCRFPGRRIRETTKKFVNCMALERGTSSNFASENLG